MRSKEFLLTITKQNPTIIGVSLIELLSSYSSDEVYLGQRDSPDWTSDPKAHTAFKNFNEKLKEVETNITAMNKDGKLKNRIGPVDVPYTLLFPYTSGKAEDNTGVTSKGIPNSVSI
uniref:Lipoxygenase domain-containing protein n=1 Tax=Leersia perrieri TaxID=77586 RepID=A0A0D9XTH2_9ORYZ